MSEKSNDLSLLLAASGGVLGGILSQRLLGPYLMQYPLVGYPAFGVISGGVIGGVRGFLEGDSEEEVKDRWKRVLNRALIGSGVGGLTGLGAGLFLTWTKKAPSSGTTKKSKTEKSAQSQDSELSKTVQNLAQANKRFATAFAKTPPQSLNQVIYERVVEPALLPPWWGAQIGSVAGITGGIIYSLDSPERRKEWFKNMLIYGTLGGLGGLVTGMVLGNTFAPIYMSYRLKPLSEEQIKDLRAHGIPEETIRLLSSHISNKRTTLFWSGLAPFLGASAGFLAGTAYALGDRERRKNWFKNMLIYSSLGTLGGAVGGRMLGGLIEAGHKALASYARSLAEKQ